MALAIGPTQLVDLGALGVTGYPFTLAGWFRVQNLNLQTILMAVGNSTSGSYHRLLYLGNTTKLAGALSNTGVSSLASSTVMMVPGQWHHAAAVFEAANLRRIYLDGGNSATNAGVRTFDGANQFYLGNLNATGTVDAAEAAVFNAALSAAEISMLAKGLSPLALPTANHLLAYQSCVRHLNWPARGPQAVAASAPSVVAHPRVMCTIGGASQVVPNRLPGPFRIAHGSLMTNAQAGQTQIAGAEANYGQMLMGGSVMGQMGLAEGEE